VKKLALILVLWIPFNLGCIAAIIVSLLAILMEENGYGKDVLRAMDKLLAAVLGFSGFYTLSAECGVTEKQPWVLLKTLLNMIQSGHCEGAARNEGLINASSP
jgi:hypothetical protein